MLRLNICFISEIFNAPYDEKWSKNKKFMLTNLRTLGGMKFATDGAIVEEICPDE